MKARKLAWVVCLLLAASAYGADGVASVELTGKLDAVTVYRGQALVTRVVEIPGPAGLREILVGDLPERVLPGSLYAESAGGVEVRSVLYRERPVEKDVRADVRKLDEEIRKVQDLAAANQKAQQTMTEEKAYLEKLAGFVAPTATTEMTKGVLNADTLQKVTQFQFTQRDEIAKQELKLGQDNRDLQEQLATLQRQRQQIADRSARTVREAVVFVNLKGAPASMQLRYLVDQATWDPSYNVRADGKGKVVVEYNASIQQQSGEDWSNVQMTLSTATPSLVANAPVLSPLSIALGTPAAGPSSGKPQSYSEVVKDFGERRAQAENMRNSGNMALNNTFNGSINVGGNVGGGSLFSSGGQPTAQMAQQGGQQALAFNGPNGNANWDMNLNDIAGEQQVAELLARDSKKEEGHFGLKAAEVISVTYPLTARTSLPSRSDRQLIQVASLGGMKSDFYRVATPVLTNYVYHQATLVNSSDKVLLAGPVASYMAGQFVGSGAIPTVAIGEAFDVGFGIDSSLRATRERVDKGETVQGGNRLLNYTYRLALENFGGEAAQVRLLDRLPTVRDTVKDSEVRVTLEPGSPDVAKDAEYQRTQRKKGILRWDVTVPAEATGEKSFTLEYQFKVEYDKQMSLVVPKAEAAK